MYDLFELSLVMALVTCYRPHCTDCAYTHLSVLSVWLQQSIHQHRTLLASYPSTMAPKVAAQKKAPQPAVQVNRGHLKQQDNIRRVYLVTIPHPQAWTSARRLQRKTSQDTGIPLASPSMLDHAAVERAFLDAARHLVYDGPNNQWHNGAVELERLAIFKELHKPAPKSDVRLPHYHVALQAKRSFRFLPFKRALRVHHQLATHWSCDHGAFYSTVRYCALPGPKKPQPELDPEPRLWSAKLDGKSLFELCQEPVTAAALQQRHEKKVRAALEVGKPEPKATEMDLYAAIVKGGFRNTPDDRHACLRLIAYLKDTAPALYTYAFKIRAKLPGLIDDVWSWEAVDGSLAALSMGRMGRLQHTASQPCQCGGEWAQKAGEVMRNNGVVPHELFSDITHSLHHGRGPSVRVLVLAGRYGGEGKSFMLAPLRSIFGPEGVQESPQPGSFPLLGLEEKQVVLLDEWRFDEKVMRMATQLLWYEGKPFPIARPQNQAGQVGHILYQGTAPIFVTTKAGDLEHFRRAADWARRHGQPSEYTMLLRRLKVYTLQVPTPTLGEATIPDCGTCFARMAMELSHIGRPGDSSSSSSMAPTASFDGIDLDDL